MRIAVAFDNLGPYHVARLRALADRCALRAIEFHARSSIYAWAARGAAPLDVETLSDGSRPVGARDVEAALDRFAPQAVLVPGWSSRPALAMLRWARKRRVPAIAMSDSKWDDWPRRALVEAVKSRVVRLFDGALVAAPASAAYARSLGIPADRIAVPYDVVDGAHFRDGAAAARATGIRPAGAPDRPFILAVARLAPEKNIEILIEALAQHRDSGRPAFDLVVLGDGPRRAALAALAARLGVGDAVRLPGWVQYDALPAWYGAASALALPSRREPWGLVVNEAAAAGLPLVVAAPCGAAEVLVEEGVNGFVVDPDSPGSVARAFDALAQAGEAGRARMGARSADLVAPLSPGAFAEAALDLAHRSLAAPSRPKGGLASRALLSALVRSRGRF